MEEIDRRPSRRAFMMTAGAGVGALGLWACSSDNNDADVEGREPDDGRGGGDGDTSGAEIRPVAMHGGVAAAPEAELQPSEYLWTGARCLFVTVPIARLDVGPWLAPGLELRDPPTATFFIARYPLTAFRSVYNEAAVLIHVSDAHGSARHCPWMVVDDDTALVYGRELLGYPKKLATITLEEGDDRIVGVVERHGTEVLRIEAERSGLTAEDGPVWNVERSVNVHGSIIGGMRLADFPPLPEEVHERATGQATVTVGTSDRDPLSELQPAEQGPAIWSVMDFATLDMVPRLSAEPLPGDWAYNMSIFSMRVQ